ncbi:MAG: sigma-70 family RNA polymerase sigma factor [Clostridia bacterium]|nr:sigma-70 family RNA polymerase sigma factor [Clostridia bacterium]
MTAKEFLNQAYRLNELIASNVEELERLRDLAVRITGINYGERVQSSRDPDPPFIRYLDDIREMEKKLQRELCELVELKKQITGSLEKMEDREERLVLTYRYFDNRTWEQIASLLNVSDRTVHRVHASALRNFPIPD